MRAPLSRKLTVLDVLRLFTSFAYMTRYGKSPHDTYSNLSLHPWILDSTAKLFIWPTMFLWRQMWTCSSPHQYGNSTTCHPSIRTTEWKSANTQQSQQKIILNTFRSTRRSFAASSGLLGSNLNFVKSTHNKSPLIFALMLKSESRKSSSKWQTISSLKWS